MRKIVLGLLLLTAIAVVVDFTAAAYSEYRVSRSLRAGGELSADPSVTMHGFPFVLQAWHGDFRNVDIRASANRPDIPGQILVEATLNGVHLPAHALLDGDTRAVPVDRVSGRMRIEPVELGRLFNIPDLDMRGPPADKSDGTGGSGGSGVTTQGALILSGTIPLGPEPRSTERVSVKADLMLDGDQVRIVATDLYHGEETAGANPVGNSVMNSFELSPDLDKNAVLARFTRTIDTRDLPFGVHPTSVKALGGNIIVEGEGENMTIDMDRFAQP
ncbi:LmeA family phospholipid-binding protein [Nocardia macrotermitis]|uniref:LmeA family phospholipid-binding protein n=1 Tax=Nocardia macrotermitis TaxID=2585198 RepID=UPI0029E82355|nr:LmeA family phospholipid-binding protein [Nocardia macrotermitis]